MDQAFFAVSGGIAIDTSPFWHRPYMSLTPSGIVLLAEMGLLPRFSQQDAQDRSRADAIAKSITCLQASWFFIQGVARVCAGLPLTLLELHTMIHIICALAMYAIWFSKPYGATSPMICSEPAMANLGALLTLRCHAGRAYNEWSCPIKDEVLVRSVLHFHPDADDEEIFAHWDAANKAIGFLRKRNIHLPFSQISTEFNGGLEFEDKFLVNTVSNMSVRGRFSNGVYKMDTPISRILFFVFPLLYCGSHLSAWNFQFPTLVEMWMWRGACFIMLCAPPSFLHFQIVMSALHKQTPNSIDGTDEDKWVDRSTVIMTRIVFQWVFIVINVFIASIVKKTFMFSRLYLVVESLASLRSPANGTYATVDWTEYLPHFS